MTAFWHQAVLTLLCGCGAQLSESSIVRILTRPRPAEDQMLASFPVAVDERGDLGLLEIFEGDEPADSAAAFCVEHGASQSDLVYPRRPRAVAAHDYNRPRLRASVLYIERSIA